MSTDSTNTRLKELLKLENVLEGTVISAGFQTDGRGQRGATWESKADENILLSILLHPKFLSIQQQFLLSQAIAIAVQKFINYYLKDQVVKIKWPNDIFVGNKKIAGMLIENILEANFIKYSIVGIGINIKQLEVLPTATSLKLESNMEYDHKQLEKDLFYFIEKEYLLLRSGAYAIIKETYLNSLLGFNEVRKFYITQSEQEMLGKILGVLDNGMLTIKDDSSGIHHTFDLKEIKFL